MPESRHQLIGFRTRQLWTTDELATFVRSIGGLYNALFAVKLLRRLENQCFDAWDASLAHVERRAHGPLEHEMIHTWRVALRAGRKTGNFPPMPLQFWPFLGEAPSQALPRPREIFENLAFYVPEDELLHIRRIEMASPGGVNFQGLGEIVRELRELLKDVWYRNQQEKVRGELDILKSYLDVKAGHPDANIPPPQYLRDRQYLLERSLKNITQVRELERAGKLESVPEHLDYAPKLTAG